MTRNVLVMLYCIGRLFFLLGLVFSIFFVTTAHAAYDLNMPYGVSPISQEIYNLHMTVFYISCVIAAVVYIAITYSLIKFRKSKGVTPSGTDEYLPIEIIWTT